MFHLFFTSMRLVVLLVLAWTAATVCARPTPITDCSLATPVRVVFQSNNAADYYYGSYDAVDKEVAMRYVVTQANVTLTGVRFGAGGTRVRIWSNDQLVHTSTTLPNTTTTYTLPDPLSLANGATLLLGVSGRARVRYLRLDPKRVSESVAVESAYVGSATSVRYPFNLSLAYGIALPPGLRLAYAVSGDGTTLPATQFPPTADYMPLGTSTSAVTYIDPVFVTRPCFEQETQTSVPVPLRTRQVGAVLYGPGLCNLTSDCRQSAVSGLFLGPNGTACHAPNHECQLRGNDTTCRRNANTISCECDDPCLTGPLCMQFRSSECASQTTKYPLCANLPCAEGTCVRQSYTGTRLVLGVPVPASDVCCPLGYGGDACELPIGCSVFGCQHNGTCLTHDASGAALLAKDTRCFGCDPGWTGLYCHLRAAPTYVEYEGGGSRRLLQNTLVRNSFERTSAANGLLFREPARTCDCGVAWNQTQGLPSLARYLLMGNYHAATTSFQRVLLSSIGYAPTDTRPPVAWRLFRTIGQAKYHCYRDVLCSGFAIEPPGTSPFKVWFFTTRTAGANSFDDVGMDGFVWHDVWTITRPSESCTFDTTYYAEQYPLQVKALIGQQIGNYLVQDTAVAAVLHYRLFGHLVRQRPSAACPIATSAYAEDETMCTNLLVGAVAIDYDPFVDNITDARCGNPAFVPERRLSSVPLTTSNGVAVVDAGVTACDCLPPFQPSVPGRYTDCADDKCARATSRGLINTTWVGTTEAAIEACICTGKWVTNPTSCNNVTGECNWCGSTLCQNGGTVNTKGECQCNDIHTGTFCETSRCNATNTYPFDESDWFRNATGTYRVGSAIPIYCDCKPGWEGKFCDEPRCIHGDFTYAEGATQACVCRPGFTGARCQEYICAQPQGYWYNGQSEAQNGTLPDGARLASANVTEGCACFPPWTPETNCVNHTCNRRGREGQRDDWNGVFPFGDVEPLNTGLQWQCRCAFPYTFGGGLSEPYDCDGHLCGPHGYPTDDYNPETTQITVNGTTLQVSSALTKCKCKASPITVFTRPKNCETEETCRPCGDGVCGLPVVWEPNSPNYDYATVSANDITACVCPVGSIYNDSQRGEGCKIFVACTSSMIGRTRIASDLNGTSTCVCIGGWVDGPYEACSVCKEGWTDAPGAPCSIAPVVPDYVTPIIPEPIPEEGGSATLSGPALYGTIAGGVATFLLGVASLLMNQMTPTALTANAIQGTAKTAVSKVAPKPKTSGRVKLGEKARLLSLSIVATVWIGLVCEPIQGAWNPGDITCRSELNSISDWASAHDHNCCGNGVGNDATFKCDCYPGFVSGGSELNLGSYQCCAKQENSALPATVTTYDCCPLGNAACSPMSTRPGAWSNNQVERCTPTKPNDCPAGVYYDFREEPSAFQSCYEAAGHGKCRVDGTRMKCQCELRAGGTEPRYGGDEGHCEFDSCTGYMRLDPSIRNGFPTLVTKQCSGNGLAKADGTQPAGCNDIYPGVCQCKHGYGWRLGAWDDPRVNNNAQMCAEKTMHTRLGQECGGYGDATREDIQVSTSWTNPITGDVALRYDTLTNRIRTCTCPPGTIKDASGICKRVCLVNAKTGTFCGNGANSVDSQGQCQPIPFPLRSSPAEETWNEACQCNAGWNGPDCSIPDPRMHDKNKTVAYPNGVFCPWGRRDVWTNLANPKDPNQPIDKNYPSKWEHFLSVTVALKGNDIAGPLSHVSHSPYVCVCDPMYEALRYTMNPDTGLCHRGCSSTDLKGCSGHGTCVTDERNGNDKICLCDKGWGDSDCSRKILRDAQGEICGGANRGEIIIDTNEWDWDKRQKCVCLSPYRSDISVREICQLPQALSCPKPPGKNLMCGGDTQGRCDKDPFTDNDYKCHCRTDVAEKAFDGIDCSERLGPVFLAQSGAEVMCTGRGILEADGSCLCNVGYVGYACEIYEDNRPCGVGQTFLDPDDVAIASPATIVPVIERPQRCGAFDPDAYLHAVPGIQLALDFYTSEVAYEAYYDKYDLYTPYDIRTLYTNSTQRAAYLHYGLYGFDEGWAAYLMTGAVGPFDEGEYLRQHSDVVAAKQTAHYNYFSYGHASPTTYPLCVY